MGCTNMLLKSRMATLPMRNFSFAPTQNTSVTNINGEPADEPNKFILNIQMSKLVTINYRMSTTLKQFQTSISKGVEVEEPDVKFFSISGARIPLCEKVEDLLEFPILCQVNKNRVFAINFCEELMINTREEVSTKCQEHYFDFAH